MADQARELIRLTIQQLRGVQQLRAALAITAEASREIDEPHSHHPPKKCSKRMLPNPAHAFRIEAAHCFTESKDRLLLRIFSVLRRKLLAPRQIGNQPLQPAA